jgi:hypothetical protein
VSVTPFCRNHRKTLIFRDRFIFHTLLKTGIKAEFKRFLYIELTVNRPFEEGNQNILSFLSDKTRSCSFVLNLCHSKIRSTFKFRTEWEFYYPLATLLAINREISDHSPILLDTGERSKVGSQNRFHFELSWLSIGIYREAKGASVIQVWQQKVSRLRSFLRGWDRNLKGNLKRHKQSISQELNVLGIKAETDMLQPFEINRRNLLKNRLLSLWREEELRWFQISKSKFLLQGDNNTKFFHLIAKGKHRKSRIIQLENDGNIITGNNNLKEYITNYYSDLFGPSENSGFSLDENYNSDITQVTETENDILNAPFSEEEVKHAIFQMKHNKAPGPDGFPAKTGRSGYPFNSDRVVRVLLNLGNGNCYPVTAKKKRYPQVRVRIWVYPIYPKYIKAQLV